MVLFLVDIMKSKTIIMGTILAVFLLLLVPSIPAVELITIEDHFSQDFDRLSFLEIKKGLKNTDLVELKDLFQKFNGDPIWFPGFFIIYTTIIIIDLIISGDWEPGAIIANILVMLFITFLILTGGI